MTMEKEIIQGYTIIEKLTIGDCVIALGENPDAVNPYVTWIGSTLRNGYNWGHYFNSLLVATEDLYLRAAAEARDQIPENLRTGSFQFHTGRENLPEYCYTTIHDDAELIFVKRGEKGYYPCKASSSDPAWNRKFADEKNRDKGVTKAQEEAMLAGSMFGWKVPAAFPENYNLDGSIKTKSQREKRTHAHER